MDLFQQLRPLLLSLYTFGLIYDFTPSEFPSEEQISREAEDKTEGSEQFRFRFRKGTRRRFGHKLFCWGICVSLWARFLAFIPAFWVGADFYPGITSNRVCFGVWLLLCSLNVTILLHGCRENGPLRKFAEAWNSAEAREKPEAPKLWEEEEEVDGDAETSATLAETDDLAAGNPSLVSEEDVLEVQPVAASERRDDRPVSDDPVKLSEQIHKMEGSSSDRSREPNGCPRDVARESTKVACGGERVKENGDFDNSQRTRHRSPPKTALQMRNKVGGVADSANNNQPKTSGKKSHHRRSRALSRETKYRKIGVIFAAVGWAAGLMNGLAVGFVMSGVFTRTEMWESLVSSPLGLSLPAKLASFALFLLASFAWAFPASLACALLVSVGTRFKELSRDMAAELERRRERFPSSVEGWRQEHLRLCHCVTVLDGTLSKMLMATYATNLPVTVYLLSSFVADVQNQLDMPLLLQGYWCLSTAATSLFLSQSAAFAHDAANEPLDLLFWVPVDKASPESLVQVQLFIAKQTGTSIGFTALGIVPVTKETLLTLAGLLVTYFLVVLQF